MEPGSYRLWSLGVQGAQPPQEGRLPGSRAQQGCTRQWPFGGGGRRETGHQEPGRPLGLKELRTGQGRLHRGTALVRRGLEGPNFHGLAESLWVQGSHPTWIWGQAVGSHLLPHDQGHT